MLKEIRSPRAQHSIPPYPPTYPPLLPSPTTSLFLLLVLSGTPRKKKATLPPATSRPLAVKRPRATYPRTPFLPPSPRARVRATRGGGRGRGKRLRSVPLHFLEAAPLPSPLQVFLLPPPLWLLAWFSRAGAVLRPCTLPNLRPFEHFNYPMMG